MSVRLVILLTGYCLLMPVYLAAQCPDRDSLWNKIIFLRDGALSSSEQLNKLLALEKQIKKDCFYQNDSTHVYLLQRIGYAYFAQYDFLKAIKYTNKAIEIINLNRQKKNVNPRQLVDCYYNLAVYYDSLKQDYQKKLAIDSCVTNSVKTNYGYVYSLYLLKGRAEGILNDGDYKRSFNYATLGESLSRKSSLDSYILGFRTIQANALVLMLEFQKAEMVLEKTIKEMDSQNLVYLGSVYDKLGELELLKGDEKKSLLYFRKSFRLNKQIGYNFGCHQALTNLGYLFYFKHDKNGPKALDCYRKAAKYLEASPPDAFESLNLQANIANVYVMEGSYDSAFVYFQNAFNCIQTGINEKGVIPMYSKNAGAYKKIDLLISLILDKGDAYLTQYKLHKSHELLGKAIDVYQTADKFFDIARKGQNETLSKLFWRIQYKRLYENAITACFLSGKVNDAFYFFEKSRAVLLNDQLSEQHLLGEKEILEIAQVNKKIIQLEKIYDTISSSGQYAEIGKELFLDRQNLNHLKNSIKDQNPLYYQHILDTNLTRIEDIHKKLLNYQDVILELFNGDSAIYSFLITSKQTFLYRISKKDFDSTVEKYTYYLSDPTRMNAHFQNYTEAASHLYQLIFQNSPIFPGRIIISPDGQYFPFEALVTSRPGEPITYFLNDHAVSYTYSIRFLLNSYVTDSTRISKNFIGFAPVTYFSSTSLASLTGSDQALYDISRHFEGAMSLVSANATRSNFMKQFYQYKIIQLYTHASDSSKNGEPVIYFADSALYLSELISENKTQTKLIVLSACETGLGKEYKGEGVFSFSRGFAALGIPSSVSNLWKIDNESTYKLTELFYKYVAAGLPLDVALQKAKLEFIQAPGKKNQLPYYWAAPILVGNTYSIQTVKSINWSYYIMALGIISLLFIFPSLIRKKPSGYF